jgi:hypothetical protein
VRGHNEWSGHLLDATASIADCLIIVELEMFIREWGHLGLLIGSED